MPRKGWVSVSVPEEMVEEVKRVIRERPDLGYKSASGYVADALRRLFREHVSMVPRFVPVKIQDDFVLLRDNKIGIEVIVYFKEEGFALCDHCKETSCVHINYALTVPEVKKLLKRRKWQRRD